MNSVSVHPVATRERPRGDLRATFAAAGFQRLLTARLVSQLADGWFQAGLAGSLLFNPERRASPLAIAAGFAILLLPYSVLGPYLGVFLDRWQRRGSLASANFARAVLVVPAAALVWSGAEGVPFAVLALLVIAANRFFLAGVGAALPHVVPDQRLVTANAVSSTLGTVCYTIGLGTAAGLLRTPMLETDFHGYGAITLIAAAGYLVSGLILSNSFTPEELGPPPSTTPRGALRAAVVDVARGMVAGLRHLARRPVAGYALLVQAGCRALFGVLTLATLLLFSDEYANSGVGSIGALGLILLAGIGGVLAGAAVTPLVTRHIPGWAWVSLALAATTIGIVTIGPLFIKPLFVIPVFLLNVAAQATKIIVDTALQHECEDEFRGRVFSVNDTAFNLTFVLGLFAAALVLPVDGESVGVVIAVACAYGALAGWYAVVGRRSEKLLR